MIPKLQRMDFPRFEGKSDPIYWLGRCEQFFRHQNTPEDAKLGPHPYIWKKTLGYGF